MTILLQQTIDSLLSDEDILITVIFDLANVII